MLERYYIDKAVGILKWNEKIFDFSVREIILYGRPFTEEANERK